MPPLRVLIETGQKRVFASALDWPGLARSGRTEAAAIEALVAAVPRFVAVAARVGLALDPAAQPEVEVVERVAGNATTDFGAPGVPGEVDRAPMTAANATRDAAFVEAAWAIFERAASRAPEELRKGPRGGGRDRSQIVDHVFEAERAYASVMGLGSTGARHRPIDDIRREILALLRQPSDGSPLGGKRWPPRYAARRIAWHAIDHAWEIEDRGRGSAPASPTTKPGSENVEEA